MPTQHPDLLEVSLSKYQPLPGERLKGVLTYRTHKEVFGHQRRIVVTCWAASAKRW